jgi:hypothetical protein
MECSILAEPMTAMRTLLPFAAGASFSASKSGAQSIMAESGLSLRPQIKLGNLNKADTRGYDPVFSICKRSEGRQ